MSVIHESTQDLLVSVHNTIYPINEQVLHQVLDPYGYVKKIDILQSSELLQAIVRFDSCQNVVWAKKQLQGRYIYDRCCQLDIQFYNKIDYEDKTENLLLENAFALDLDFIRNTLQEMMVIIERMQDRMKARNSSNLFTAVAANSTTRSSPSVCIRPASAPSALYLNNSSSILEDSPKYILRPSDQDSSELPCLEPPFDQGISYRVPVGATNLKVMQLFNKPTAALVNSGVGEFEQNSGVVFSQFLDARPAMNLAWLNEQKCVDARNMSVEMVKPSELPLQLVDARHLFDKITKPTELSLQLPKYETNPSTVSIFYLNSLLDCLLILGGKIVFTFDPGGRDLKYKKIGFSQVNTVLIDFPQSMNQVEYTFEIYLVAIKLLYSTLGFAQFNFENQMGRDHMMSVLCKKVESKEVEIRQVSFARLVAISWIYYEYLEPYMTKLFMQTANAINNNEESIALQALVFWRSNCDEETEINEQHGKHGSSVAHSQLIQNDLTTLVSMLLDTLLKQKENQDQVDGRWNLSMIGGTCLRLVAKTVGNKIMLFTMSFVDNNILKVEWRNQEAATFAFGSIPEGPSIQTISLLFHAGYGFLPSLVKDTKDTAALISASNCKDIASSTLRASTYETLNETVRLLVEIMTRQGKTIGLQITMVYDKEKQNELPALLCGVHQLFRMFVLELCMNTSSTTFAPFPPTFIACDGFFNKVNIPKDHIYVINDAKGAVDNYEQWLRQLAKTDILEVSSLIPVALKEYGCLFLISSMECTKMQSESKVFIFDPGGTFDIGSIFDLEDKVVFRAGGNDMTIHTKAAHSIMQDLREWFNHLKDIWTRTLQNIWPGQRNMAPAVRCFPFCCQY